MKHSALYGDPCPLCRPGAAGCVGSFSAPFGGCESRVRAGDGPEAAAEVDNGGVRADGADAEAAVEVGIGGDGQPRGRRQAVVRADSSSMQSARACRRKLSILMSRTP